MPTPITESARRLTTPDELRRWSLRCHAAGMTVGLVATMGALHAGHVSLIDRARAECDRGVVSIFVNPTRFGAGDDLTRSPRPRRADLATASASATSALFVPPVQTR